MSKPIITFGKWNNQPIEWEILKEDDFCKLIITKDRIGGTRQFNRNNDSQWKNSEIRQFLNGEFLNQAFTNEEKTKIVNVYLEKPNATKDNIFLLDVDEAKPLISNDWYHSYYGSSCSSCCWYRTPNYSGYPNLCNCSNRAPNNSRSIRPALYLKK